MKETTKMSRAVSQLEHIYNSLNTDFFSAELPVPIITVQSKPGTYGHCTTAKVWQRKNGGAGCETCLWENNDELRIQLYEATKYSATAFLSFIISIAARGMRRPLLCFAMNDIVPTFATVPSSMFLEGR